MIKKALSIMICTLILLMGVPFKSLAAATISSSNIVGVNVSVVDYEVIGDNVFNTDYPKSSFILKFELVLDKEYLGYLTGKFTCSIFGHDSQGQQLQINVDSGNKSFYVCGQTLTYYVEQKLYFSNTPTSTYVNIYTPSFTLAGSNVVEFGLLQTLEDIQRAIEMMDFHTEQITQYLYDSSDGSILEQVVTTNQLLVDAGQMFYNVMITTDNINNYVIDMFEYMEAHREYSFPIESYNAISKFIFDNYTEVFPYGAYKYYQYPAFQVNNGDIFATTYVNVPSGEYAYIDFVCYILNSTTSLPVSAENMTWYNQKTLNYFASSNSTYSYNYLMHFTYRKGESGNVRLRSTGNYVIIPIFFGYRSSEHPYYLSDDFAQQFDLIDTSYQQTLDDNTDQMQSEFNDLFTIEDDYGDQLNNQLNNIDFTNPLQNNSSMLSSGNFVIQVFNGLIANNPLSILIIIVCIFFVARRLFG